LVVDPSGKGNITGKGIVWTSRKSIPDISSALIVNDWIYFTNEGGVVSCLELSSGKNRWKGRIRGNHWASPIYQAGKIYFFSKEGRISVISSGKEFKKLATNEFDTSFVASPAVAEDKLIVRSATDLYCFSQLKN